VCSKDVSVYFSGCKELLYLWPWRCGLMARPVSGVEWSGVEWSGVELLYFLGAHLFRIVSKIVLYLELSHLKLNGSFWTHSSLAITEEYAAPTTWNSLSISLNVY